jgi:hypothetical protein
MYENCTCNEELELDVEQEEQEEQFDIGTPVLKVSGEDGLVYFDPIEMNRENILDIVLDIKKFKIGVEKASELCGMYHAFLNVGMDSANAIGTALNVYKAEHQANMDKLNSETNIEISKNSSLEAEKNSL